MSTVCGNIAKILSVCGNISTKRLLSGTYQPSVNTSIPSSNAFSFHPNQNVFGRRLFAVSTIVKCISARSFPDYNAVLFPSLFPTEITIIHWEYFSKNNPQPQKREPRVILGFRVYFPPTLDSRTTSSVCRVFGNMSTAQARAISYPAAANDAISRTKLSGLHAT